MCLAYILIYYIHILSFLVASLWVASPLLLHGLLWCPMVPNGYVVKQQLLLVRFILVSCG